MNRRGLHLLSGRAPDCIDPDRHLCQRCGVDLNQPRCNGGTHRCADCIEVEKWIRWEEEAEAKGMTLDQYVAMKQRISEKEKRRYRRVKREQQEEREAA